MIAVRNRVWKFFGLLLVVILWELLARSIGSPMLPAFTQVFPTFMRMHFQGELNNDIQASMTNVFIGLGLASTSAFILALFMHQSPLVHLIIMPIADSIRPVAALTIFPLLILVLGLGMWSKVVVIIWTAWPAILLNTLQGLISVPSDYTEAAALDGASPLEILRYIKIPLAIGYIMTGINIGMSGGFISLVSSEMLGANEGLGYSVLAYSQTFRFAEMYATVITIALIGLFLNIMVAQIQRVVTAQIET